MGAFSKALKDTQYLQPLAQSLIQYKQRMQEAEGRKQLLEIMQNAQKQTQEDFTSTPEVRQNVNPFEVAPTNKVDPTVTQPVVTPDYPFTPRNIAPTSRANVPPITTNSVNDPATEITKQAFDPKTNPKDYETARTKAFTNIYDAYQKGLTNKNVDPQKLGALVDLFTKTNIPEAPKTGTIVERDKEKDYYYKDPYTGKETLQIQGTGKKQDTQDYELDEKTGEPKEYKLSNGQFAYKKITKDNTGKIIKTEFDKLSFEPKGTSVTIINPNENKAKVIQGISEVTRMKDLIASGKPFGKDGKIKVTINNKTYTGTPEQLRLDLVDKIKSEYKGYAWELLADQGFAGVYDDYILPLAEVDKNGVNKLAKYDFDQWLEYTNVQRGKKGEPPLEDPKGILRASYNLYRE